MTDTGESSKNYGRKKSLHCKNLHEYLKTLNESTLHRLYNHPITCLAVYREYEEAIIPLKELRIWTESTNTGDLRMWELNPIFKKNIRIALLGGGSASTMRGQLEADSKPRDIAFLDTYAAERWECVLHYMVGSHQQEGISMDAVKILLHAGLMKCGEDGSAIITNDGFQFLLMDTSAQVWYFILQYLDTVEAIRGMDLPTCLVFLFQLRFSILGKDYSTEGMSENLLMFLQHLREFGLVYQRKRKAGRFYPTRLALNMASGKNEQPNVAFNEEGFIITETNYRIYAYTDSNLKVALVALFTDLLYRFPNVTVGVLTRDSVRAALKSGITAEQIVGFLKMHAHPRMKSDQNKLSSVSLCEVLPPTVVDQIYLWEQERNRCTYTEGVLYTQFISQQQFDVLRDYAIQTNALVWQNERRRTMVVTRNSHDDVRKFWKAFNKK